MSLKKQLDAGIPVVGSKFDGKIKPLGAISDAAQKRHGYADVKGYWTDRGYNRATSADFANLEKSRVARQRSGK